MRARRRELDPDLPRGGVVLSVQLEDEVDHPRRGGVPLPPPDPQQRGSRRRPGEVPRRPPRGVVPQRGGVAAAADGHVQGLHVVLGGRRFNRVDFALNIGPIFSPN